MYYQSIPIQIDKLQSSFNSYLMFVNTKCCFYFLSAITFIICHYLSTQLYLQLLPRKSHKLVTKSSKPQMSNKNISANNKRKWLIELSYGEKAFYMEKVERQGFKTFFRVLRKLNSVRHFYNYFKKFLFIFKLFTISCSPTPARVRACLYLKY